MRIVLLLHALLLGLASPQALSADNYPSRPIRLVVPQAAGTSADRYARLIAVHLGEALKQPVVVDNRPGAGGTIGADTVAKAAPDGYTLLYGNIAISAINPHLYKELPFDSQKDFIPVAGAVRGYMYLFVPANSPANSLREFIQLTKDKQGRMNYGSLGVGSVTHLTMEDLKSRTGIAIDHIPYKNGTPDVVRALIAGEIDAAFDFYTPVMAQVKAGRLKALGITSLVRNPAVPHIPTLHEQGATGLESVGWSGVFAPANTPQAVVDRLNAEIASARAAPDVQKTLQEAGGFEIKGSPSEFAAFVRQEYVRGERMVKLSGARAE